MWSKKYNKCLECKTTKRKHKAKGLCKNCYNRTDVNSPKRGRTSRDKLFFNGNRQKTIERDGVCIICKNDVDIVVHHKDENQQNNEIDNLVALCRSCHSKLHKYLRLKKFFANYPMA